MVLNVVFVIVQRELDLESFSPFCFGSFAHTANAGARVESG